jgi:hypothetical protein
VTELATAAHEVPRPLTDAEATRQLAEPHGVWTRAAAVALLGRRRVDRLTGTAWVAPWPGVLAPADVPLDRVTTAKAALLASGGLAPRTTAKGTRVVAAVLCGRSALRWYELPLIDDADPATGGDEARIHDVHTWTRQRDLVVPAPGDAPRELRRHRLTLRKGELWRSASGVWVLSPARALFDGARLLTLEALVCAMDAALFRELCTRDELEETARAHLGREGAPRFRHALALADGRAESSGESLTRLLLLPALPRLQPQVRVVDERGRVVARLDLGDEESLFAVEFDGRSTHAGEAMVARDRRRARATGRHGWWTERVTWFDVRCRAEATRASVVEEHRRWSEVTRLRRGARTSN